MSSNKVVADISDIINTIIKGDSIETLKRLPSSSVDLIFADPPYFMQTTGVLLRTSGTKFNGVSDEWDKFRDYEEYDKFSSDWLAECYRVLKPNGTIWVIGAFQNIYRIGYIMQNLGFWILNDVVWNKTNPTPNFKGTRFTNSNETMLWCSKSKDAKYTFNYQTMKFLNSGKQMKSVWDIGLCIGNERLKDEQGNKVHSTQKPSKLLLNVLLSSSKSGDIVLDPFMGSGTTGAVAKQTGRSFIGIERDETYIHYANKRIDSIVAEKDNKLYLNALDIAPPRVPIKQLITSGYLKSGEKLYNRDGSRSYTLDSEGSLEYQDKRYSIHKLSAILLHKPSNNGWLYWFAKKNDQLVPLEDLRALYRKRHLNYEQVTI